MGTGIRLSPEARTKYLELLGLQGVYNAKDIDKKYKKLALKLHPDKNPDDPTSQEKFQLLGNAKDQLLKDLESDIDPRSPDRDGGAPSFATGFSYPFSTEAEPTYSAPDLPLAVQMEIDIHHNQVEHFNYLLTIIKDDELNKPDIHGMTLLQWAVTFNRTEMAKQLLARMSEEAINLSTNRQRTTALEGVANKAVYNRKQEEFASEQWSLVSELIKRGAHFKNVKVPDNASVERSLSEDDRHMTKISLLECAAINGKKDAVIAMLSSKQVDAREITRSYTQALRLAVRHKQKDLVSALIEFHKEHQNLKISIDSEILVDIVRRGDLDIMNKILESDLCTSKLLNPRSEYVMPPLFVAMELEDTGMAIAIINSPKCNADVLNGSGSGFTTLRHAALQGKKDVVDAILKSEYCTPALINAKYDGETALNSATKGGHMEIAKALVGKGAEVSFSDAWYAKGDAAWLVRTEYMKQHPIKSIGLGLLACAPLAAFVAVKTPIISNLYSISKEVCSKLFESSDKSIGK